ncbi:MAG: MarR family transcriptional regulator [Odoribacter sp.]|nr:MarR family transcriptional regulator [Odoribacter sp.]
MNKANELFYLLSKAERSYTAHLNRSFHEAGYPVSQEQYELLRVLWEEDNINQQTISQRLEKNKYNVTKLLNTLCKRGYVERKMGKEDKRNNYVVLTDLGRKVQAFLNDIEERKSTDIMFTLSSEEIKSCIWTLKRMTDLM